MKAKGIIILSGSIIVAALLVFLVVSQQTDEYVIDEQEQIPSPSDALFTKSNTEQSFEDELLERVDGEDDLQVAVTGSSVAAGEGASEYNQSWAALLEGELNRNESLPPVEVENFGVSGFKVSDLLAEGVIDDMINSEPDVVIMETSVINSYFHEEPLDETKQSIQTAVDQIKNDLPDTYLVLIAPNPISESIFSFSTNELEFEEYVLATEEYILESEWDYFDSYNAWTEELEYREEDLDNLLGDGVHPNDEGYHLWYSLLNESVVQYE
ncbi:SGNH/GDSL hydrolase family protein [Alkalicoccobacillus murimartini]|uniref:Lysophospholipase L1-like esterase n=1 Tax=Alkalicoccobacillus murimartini TaxID=171685 RepID=A0ABT9YDC5_9BACI|nr:SGNH/GDSL hydrolase family protein [Alkalicoccobacillus murimartini]MDQ0205485.1 lysophospholipase L1-like esterase [Alkalicoccobacillus murimartini]